MDLEKIKSERLKELEALASSPLRWKIKAKKALYLLKYGMPPKKIIKYLWLFGTAAAFKFIKFIKFGGRVKNDKGKCYIAVNMGNAGIGDAIVAVRAVRDIIEQIKNKSGEGGAGENIGDKIAVDYFYSSPQAIEFIALPQQCVRKVMGLHEYKLLSRYYGASFKLNTFFISEHINKNKKTGSKNDSSVLSAVSEIIKNIKAARKPIEKYVKLRPFSEGVLSEITVNSGYSRETYLNYAAGLDISGENGNKKSADNILNLDIDKNAIFKFKLNGKKFITVHDGWDENTRIKHGFSSTKSYPLENWIKLAKELKAGLPGYKIVQIGGAGNGSDIGGTDYNLRGRTTLKEAAGILAHSAIHIDTDSGLVHIAASLGVKCAVLFGPTNISYCSYEQNINIAPKKCGGCWWSTDGWMGRCPRGLETPECMASIEPGELAEIIKNGVKNGV